MPNKKILEGKWYKYHSNFVRVEVVDKEDDMVAYIPDGWSVAKETPLKEFSQNAELAAWQE